MYVKMISYYFFMSPHATGRIDRTYVTMETKAEPTPSSGQTDVR